MLNTKQPSQTTQETGLGDSWHTAVEYFSEPWQTTTQSQPMVQAQSTLCSTIHPGKTCLSEKVRFRDAGGGGFNNIDIGFDVVTANATTGGDQAHRPEMRLAPQ